MATTITLQPSPGNDTYIASANPTTNYGTNDTLYLGYSSSAVNSCRILIKMDLSSIPFGSTILSSKLYITVTADNANTTGTISAYRLLRNWNLSQATYNVYSTGNSWGTAGGTGSGDIDLSVGAWGTCATGSADAIGTVREISLNTTEFAKLVNNTYNNYGWLLKTADASSDLYKYAGGDSATESIRPKLIIEYIAPAGGEPVSVSPFFNFFKNFENPWMKGGVWQPNNKGLVTI